MENASKALIMASTVLIGVLLLSIMAYLFTTFGNTGKEINSKIQEKNLAEFNANFLKYENKYVRAQDIVSIANLARENNISFEYNSKNKDSGDNYIKVIVQTKKGRKIENFEELSNYEYENFLRKYSGYYEEENQKKKFKVTYFECTAVTINKNSKRVSSISFKESEDKHEVINE